MTTSTNTTQLNQKRSAGRALGAGLILVVLLALALSTFIVQATNHQLSEAGYADFAYGDPSSDTIPDEPTEKGSQSKVWWHDNFWWAVMFNNAEDAYHIYQLDASTQKWIDTGVVVDDRFNQDPLNEVDTRADVLSDGDTLYVLSHVKQEDGVFNNNSAKWARVYRFNYDDGNTTYVLDEWFPVANYLAEAMVLDMDSTGRLWVTYVARDPRTTASTNDYVVRLSYSDTNGENWDTEGIILPVSLSSATVDKDDISAVVAFTDGGGSKIGVMWSNQVDDQFYFATHPDSSNPEADWTIDANFTSAFPAANYPADDHIDFAPTSGGPLFAVVKTNNMPTSNDPVEADGDPLVSVFARNTAGAWTHIPVSPAESLDTRPVAVVEGNQLHVFTVSKPTAPSQVCIHTATITSPLSNMDFATDNCTPPAGEQAGSLASLVQLTAATPFIGDTTTYTAINSPTTVKGWVGTDSGVVVLASDQPHMYYVHNHKLGSYVQPTLTPVPGTPTNTPTSTSTATATSTATPTATATTVPPTVTVTVTIPPGQEENIHLPIIIDELD